MSSACFFFFLVGRRCGGVSKAFATYTLVARLLSLKMGSEDGVCWLSKNAIEQYNNGHVTNKGRGG